MKDPWADSPYKNMDDCLTWVRFYIGLGSLFFMTALIFFQSHFALVLYTHYKNAMLVKSKGGCLPDADANDVQITNLPTFSSVMDDSSTSGRVQHAVDDEDLRHAQRMTQLTV